MGGWAASGRPPSGMVGCLPWGAGLRPVPTKGWKGWSGRVLFWTVFRPKLQFEGVACRGGPWSGFTGFLEPAGWWVRPVPEKAGPLAPVGASSSLDRSRPAQPARPAFDSY